MERKLCGNGLVCVPEGISVPCGLITMRYDKLHRFCEEFGDKFLFVETEVIPPRPTRSDGGSTTMPSLVTKPEGTESARGSLLVFASSQQVLLTLMISVSIVV